MASSGLSNDGGHCRQLLNRLNDQRECGNYCDVHLKVAGRHLAAHSSVLAACSPFFQSVFERRNQISVSLKAGILELDVPGMLGPLVGLESGGLEAVQGLLTYIYTGHIELNAINAELVVQLADVVMLDSLSDLARKFLQHGSPSSTRTLPCRPSAETKSPQIPQQIFVRQSPVGAAEDPEPPKLAVNPSNSHALSLNTSSDIKRPCRKVHQRKPKPEFVLKNITRFKQRSVSRTDSKGSEDDLAGSETSFGLMDRKKTFRCLQCSFVSDNTRKIRLHRKIHCGKVYVCSCCGFIAFQAHELLDHMVEAKHSEKVCSLCGFKAQTIASFEEHLQKHNDRKPFFCVSCSLRFRTRTALSHHIPEHMGKQTTGATRCEASKLCKSPTQTHEHIDRGNAQLISSRAVHCSHSENFTNRSSLPTELQDLRHRVFAHIKLKQHQCEICGQKFSHAKNKQIHARIHHFGTVSLEPSTRL